VKVQLKLHEGIRIRLEHLAEILHIAFQRRITKIQLIVLLGMTIVVPHKKSVIILAHIDLVILARNVAITDKEGRQENKGHDCYDYYPGSWPRKFFPGPRASNGLNLLGNHRCAHELQQFILSSRPIVIFACMQLWRPMRITIFLLALACNRYKREICLTTTK
jgi:hypothetical protein